jgi:hypothetical protein
MNNNIETIINERGRPNLLISANANGKWHQVANNLMKDQTYNNRPDVVGYVFFIKLKQLLRKLRDGTYFHGNIVEYVLYSITWKKGNLPMVNIIAKLLLNETVISISHHPQALMDWDGYIHIDFTTNSIDLTKFIDDMSKAEIKPVLQVYVD